MLREMNSEPDFSHTTTNVLCYTTCYTNSLLEFGDKPRKPYFQVPVTDAEHYFRLLLLPDIKTTSLTRRIPCVLRLFGNLYFERQ